MDHTARLRERMVAALSVTQTVGYGVLFYAFGVLLLPMSVELGTGTPAVAGALTLSLLIAAGAGIPVGRWLDRHGGTGLMTTGSLLGTVALLLCSRVRSVPQLYGVFVLIGLSAAMVLYEPAFALVVRRYPPARRPGALLAITIVAGFSATVFLPLTGLLERSWGWRSALVVLAIIQLVVTVPLHARFLDRPSAVAAVEAPVPAAADVASVSAGTALREFGFWLLTAAFFAHGAAVSVVGIHVVAMLILLGHPAAFAATAAGLLGVLSVAGRIVATRLARRSGPTGVAVVVFTIQAAAIGLLPVVGRTSAGAIACLVLFGAGYGVGTIARPALLADRYGTTAYATIASVLTLPMNVSKALAPLGAALLFAATGSYTAVCLALAVACLVTSACLILAARTTRRIPDLGWFVPPGRPQPSKIADEG